MRYPVRRKDKEITDLVILKKILKSAKYVTIAMSKDNKPYLVTLSHGYDEEQNCIYFHCAKEGKKLDYLNANNLVWGQAILDYGHSVAKDPFDCSYIYASVHFSGKIAFTDDTEEKRHALECMMRQLAADPEPMIERLKPECLDKALIGRIDIDYVSGKKSKEVTL